MHGSPACSGPVICLLKRLVCRHLPKNFDNVHNLEFRKDAEGNPTKTAIGMYSGQAPLLCVRVYHASD